MSFLLYMALLAFNACYGIAIYNKIGKAYRLLVQLISIVFLFELSSKVFIQYNLIKTNFPWYHVLLPIQLLYNGFVYHSLHRKISNRRNLLKEISFTVLALTLFIDVFYQEMTSFPHLSFLILSLFVIANALIYYYKMIRIPEEISVLKQAGFWLNSGNFFFYGVTFFVFGYFEYVQGAEKVTPTWVSILIKISNFVLYGCSGLCIYLAHKKAEHVFNKFK